MTDEAKTAPLPAVTDRATWQARLDKLLVREKAHTREGDAIAAARRQLPMVEVDAGITLTGARGPVSLLEVFEGRRQLIVYYHMWHAGQPAADQCEGCTFFNGQVRELSYLHSRDVTYATFCQGPYEESARYRDFMGWDVPWYSAQDSVAELLAGRWFGMQVVLSARRRPGVRDVLEQRPRRGGDVTQLCAARHDGVRAPGGVGGLAGRLAGSVRYRWRPVPASRAAHRAVGAPGGRPVRRPRHRHRLGLPRLLDVDARQNADAGAYPEAAEPLGQARRYPTDGSLCREFPCSSPSLRLIR